MKTNKNIVTSSILKLTKRYIKNDESFCNFYHKKSTVFFEKQLPLINQSKKTSETLMVTTRNLNRNFSTNDISVPLQNIRVKRVKPKDLPRLCPLYNDKGEIISDVVNTMKLGMPQFFEASPIKKGNNLSIPKCTPYNKNFLLDMNSFKYEILSDAAYHKLNYNENEIFGRAQHWANRAKEIMYQINQAKQNDNLTDSISKSFTLKGNIAIDITVRSLKITFVDQTLKSPQKKSNSSVALPFALLPFFYSKGEVGFKNLLTSLIRFTDDSFEKVEINEKALYEDITDGEKRSRKGPEGESMGLLTSLPRNQKLVKKLSPCQCSSINDKDYSYYTKYTIPWITPKKKYIVEIDMPHAIIRFPQYDITITKYLNMEMIMYLYDKKFLFWDFYIVNYIFTFKLFRSVLKRVLSHNKIYKIKLYLLKPKVKEQSDANTFRHLICTDTSHINRFIIAHAGTLKVQFEYPQGIIRQYVIKLSFSQMQKVFLVGSSGCDDKKNFLLKFLKFNSDRRSLDFEYTALDSFNAYEWILDKQKFSSDCPKLSECQTVFRSELVDSYIEIFGTAGGASVVERTKTVSEEFERSSCSSEKDIDYLIKKEICE